MTATQCASVMNCSIAAWSQWEKGKRDPGLESIPAICKMFGVSAGELFGIDRGSSAATVVNGSCNAVATGPNARASVTIGNAGEMAACRKCKYLKAIKRLQKAGLQLPDDM